MTNEKELPGDWTSGIGSRSGETYTHWYYLDEWGEQAEKDEFGEWIAEYNTGLKMMVYHDAGNRHHFIDLFTVYRYPEGHEQPEGDVAHDEVLETRRCEREDEAMEIAEELMEIYQ